jgi:hypothetical protein
MSLESDGGMIYWQGKTKELGEKPVPVPLCPPKIPHGSTRARTRASAVRGQRLTAWGMARPRRQKLTKQNLYKVISILKVNSVSRWLVDKRLETQCRTDSQSGIQRPHQWYKIQQTKTGYWRHIVNTQHDSTHYISWHNWWPMSAVA